MRVWIVRHGEAEPWRSDDALRPLTARGREQVAESARYLAGSLPVSCRIVCSPYIRARQTADILASILGVKAVEVLAEITPEGDARVVTKWLAEQGTADIMLVSHMPLVGRLASWLEDGCLDARSFGLAELLGLEMEVAGVGQGHVVMRHCPA